MHNTNMPANKQTDVETKPIRIIGEIEQSFSLELEEDVTIHEAATGALRLLIKQARLLISTRLLKAEDLDVKRDIDRFYADVYKCLAAGDVLVESPRVDYGDSHEISERVAKGIVASQIRDAITEAAEIDTELRRDLEDRLAAEIRKVPRPVRDAQILVASLEERDELHRSQIKAKDEQIGLNQLQKAEMQLTIEELRAEILRLQRFVPEEYKQATETKSVVRRLGVKFGPIVGFRSRYE